MNQLRRFLLTVVAITSDWGNESSIYNLPDFLIELCRHLDPSVDATGVNNFGKWPYFSGLSRI